MVWRAITPSCELRLPLTKGMSSARLVMSFNAAFESALDGLLAALSAQYALNSEDWGRVDRSACVWAAYRASHAARDEYDGYLTLVGQNA